MVELMVTQTVRDAIQTILDSESSDKDLKDVLSFHSDYIHHHVLFKVSQALKSIDGSSSKNHWVPLLSP